MTAELATKTDPSTSLITAFADAQMSDYVREHIEESTFLELAACAFFCGAEAREIQPQMLEQRRVE